MSLDATFGKVVTTHLSRGLKGLGTWPILGTLLFHAAFAGGLYASGKLDKKKKKEKPVIIEFDVPPPPAVKKPKPLPKKAVAPKPPPPPPPKVEDKKPPPVKQPPPRRRIVRRTTQPPPTRPPPTNPDPNPNPDPAPGPGNDDDVEYKLPDAVPDGSFGTPKVGGQPNRSGSGTGAGGSKKGSGKPGPPPPPKPVSIAAIKKRAMPIGNTDFIQSKDYPPKAKEQGIQGKVKVKLVVNAKGRVVKRTLVKRLGYGLDQLALRYARKLRFTPAIDTNDRAVPSTVVWTFTFTLPK